MIFSLSDHIEQIKAGTKTQTRRPNNRYKTGQTYAVQPGRGKKGIPEGRIYVAEVIREWKPDLTKIPEHAHFARSWAAMDSGYPIRGYQAKAEGGYSPFVFEELYEKMYPDWTERYAIWFSFFTEATLLECGYNMKGEKINAKN